MRPFLIVTLVACALITAIDVLAMWSDDDHVKGMAVLHIVPLVLALVALSCALGGVS